MIQVELCYQCLAATGIQPYLAGLVGTSWLGYLMMICTDNLTNDLLGCSNLTMTQSKIICILYCG